jgi:thymidylate kinase
MGKLIIPAAELLSERERGQTSTNGHPDFYIPSPAMAFIYYLIKKVEKGHLSDRHGDYLSSEWRKNPVGASAQAGRFWSGHNLETVTYAASQNDWSAVRSALPELKIALHREVRISIWHWLRELARKVRRILQPTGLHIVFLGPDGSGKTTVLTQVQEILTPIFRRTRSYHLRPYFGASRIDNTPNPNPHGIKPRDILSSLAKLGMWWADYTVGYAIEIFPRLIRSTLVLFDRYYHDLAIDPRRYRYGGPIWLARLIGKCMPSPDLVILLDAPTKIMQARKQEVPFAETERLRKLYLKFISETKNGYIVDGSLPLNMVVEQVNRIVLDKLSQRINQRQHNHCTI